LMSTWKKGREILGERLSRHALPFEEFVASLKPDSPSRVPGIAVFMSRDAGATPAALLHNLKHNKVLHEKVVLLTVANEEIPQVPRENRLEISDLGKGCYRIIAHYRFLQGPGGPHVLSALKERGIDLPLTKTTFFLSRETLIPSKRPGMAVWREKL